MLEARKRLDKKMMTKKINELLLRDMVDRPLSYSSRDRSQDRPRHDNNVCPGGGGGAGGDDDAHSQAESSVQDYDSDVPNDCGGPYC